MLLSHTLFGLIYGILHTLFGLYYYNSTADFKDKTSQHMSLRNKYREKNCVRKRRKHKAFLKIENEIQIKSTNEKKFSPFRNNLK